MSAILGISAIFVALCLRPSAIDPHPISVLLKTNTKPQFDRTVDRAVEAFFRVFSRLKSGPISATFFVFTVGSAEGSQIDRGVG
jgi:hypothetical protein